MCRTYGFQFLFIIILFFFFDLFKTHNYISFENVQKKKKMEKKFSFRVLLFMVIFPNLTRTR